MIVRSLVPETSASANSAISAGRSHDNARVENLQPFRYTFYDLRIGRQSFAVRMSVGRRKIWLTELLALRNGSKPKSCRDWRRYQ